LWRMVTPQCHTRMLRIGGATCLPVWWLSAIDNTASHWYC
jgi:hypothetical protein